jgi:hypothetical protein
MMELIKNLEINPFTSTIWVSEKARKTWQHIIYDCSEMVQRLELLSVMEDQRLCAWRTIPVEQITVFTTECMKLGLNVYPIKNVGRWNDGFSHKTPQVIPGKPISSYCIISKSIEAAKGFEEAHNRGDHITQAHYLGFPECCAKFFGEIWPKYVDPIWQIATNDSKYYHPHLPVNKIIENLYYSKLTNPILRYIGLRIGFHIPCSFNCSKTTKIAEERLSLCKSKKDKETSKLLIALLSMPMEWNAYRGILQIKTPIFYLKTNTLPCKERHIVRLHGSFIPREAAKGINFPF